MIVIKLSCYVASRLVRTKEKPIQRYIIPFETTARHGLDAPLSHHPLNTQGREMLQEFSELGRVYLFVFKLAIMIVFWLILTKRDNRRIKQLKLLIQSHLRERKRNNEC